MDIHLEIKNIMENVQTLNIPATYGHCVKIKSILESLIAINNGIPIESSKPESEEPLCDK